MKSPEKIHACMIAGTHSSVGKTIWSLSLMAALKAKGLRVQPFKAGPDYIDPSFHHELCAPRRSRNLDLFLLSERKVAETFSRHAKDADFLMVEGMMGLFDGTGPEGLKGSSAEIAKLLKLPVLLVVDGAGLATSAAAVVLGFRDMDPALSLAGVLVNRVSHERHFQWLKKAIEERTGIPCLGYLPPDDAFAIPERHLGLTTALEIRGKLEKMNRAAAHLEKHLDWNTLFKQTEVAPPKAVSAPAKRAASGVRARIGVAYDTAFSFYYEDNFDRLREAGAELLFFSPMTDAYLPENLDLLYFGGGFPEVYAGRLAENREMIRAVRDFYGAGGYLYAECGGLIYLAEAFVDSAQKEHPLVGLVPGRVSMTGRLQHFGYHEAEALADTFLFRAGQMIRSHEFHYSVWEEAEKLNPAYRIGSRFDGHAQDRLVASYQHLHFDSDAGLASRLVQSVSGAGRHA